MKGPDFSENVVIITGAASGIGREISLQLAAQGAWLALASRDTALLEQVALKCRQNGGKALVVPTDVTEELHCKKLIDRTLEEYGRIDTLINNAGLTMWAPFDEIQDLSLMENIMRVNYFGSVYCTYYALPYLKQTKGRIAGIASLAGVAGVPTRSGYAASKHAMAGFFDSLRIELADCGVSVTVIYPGFVATEARKRALGPDGKPIRESRVDERKVMAAVDCARLIVKAIAGRRRDLVMTLRGKLGLWLKLIAPGLVDKMARAAIEKGK